MNNMNLGDIERIIKDFSDVYNNLVNETNFNNTELASIQAVKIEIVNTYLFFLEDLVKKRISVVDDETQEKILEYRNEIQNFRKKNFNYEESVHYEFFKLILDVNDFYQSLIKDVVKRFYSVFEDIKSSKKTAFEEKDELIKVITILKNKLKKFNPLIETAIKDKLIQHPDVRIEYFHSFLEKNIEKEFLRLDGFENFYNIFIKDKSYSLKTFIKLLEDIIKNLKNNKDNVEDFEKNILFFIDKVLLIFLHIFKSLNSRIDSYQIKDYFKGMKAKIEKLDISESDETEGSLGLFPEDLEEELSSKKKSFFKRVFSRNKKFDPKTVNWEELGNRGNEIINILAEFKDVDDSFILEEDKRNQIIANLTRIRNGFPEDSKLYNEVQTMINYMGADINPQIKKINLERIVNLLQAFYKKIKKYSK